LNLLQGVYRPKTQSSNVKKSWVWCGISASSLIAFLFLSQATQWIYLSHQTNLLNKQVLLAYQKIFPNSTEVLEPRFRVAGLLTRLKRESSGNAFLHLLAVTGKVLTQYPQISIQSLKFGDERLTLQVTTPATQLNNMVNALDQAGLKVQQQSEKAGKSEMNATLIIREST